MNSVAPVIDSNKREIGYEAVWSLSTAKPGNGVEQIRDGMCACVRRARPVDLFTCVRTCDPFASVRQR